MWTLNLEEINMIAQTVFVSLLMIFGADFQKAFYTQLDKDSLQSTAASTILSVSNIRDIEDCAVLCLNVEGCTIFQHNVYLCELMKHICGPLSMANRTSDVYEIIGRIRHIMTIVLFLCYCLCTWTQCKQPFWSKLRFWFMI